MAAVIPKTGFLKKCIIMCTSKEVATSSKFSYELRALCSATFLVFHFSRRDLIGAHITYVLPLEKSTLGSHFCQGALNNIAKNGLKLFFH